MRQHKKLRDFDNCVKAAVEAKRSVESVIEKVTFLEGVKIKTLSSVINFDEHDSERMGMSIFATDAQGRSFDVEIVSCELADFQQTMCGSLCPEMLPKMESDPDTPEDSVLYITSSGVLPLGSEVGEVSREFVEQNPQLWEDSRILIVHFLKNNGGNSNE